MGKSIKVRRRRPIELSENQWRRLNGARGHVFPQFYKWLGTGGTASRRTADKKLTKLYRPPRKRSPKQLIVLLEPKSGEARPKKIFPAVCAGPVPLPTFAPDWCSHTFKFVPAPLLTTYYYHFPTYAVHAAVLYVVLQLKKTANIPPPRPRRNRINRNQNVNLPRDKLSLPQTKIFVEPQRTAA